MRGGKREGAGRKPAPNKKIRYTVRLHPKIIEQLKREWNASAEIEKALCKHFDIDLT